MIVRKKKKKKKRRRDLKIERNSTSITYLFLEVLCKRAKSRTYLSQKIKFFMLH